MMEITTIVTIMGVPSAITAFCFGCLKKYLDKREKERVEREKAREMNEFLLMDCVGASLDLGEATAKAIKSGKCNGEMTCALERVHKVKGDQQKFFREQISKYTH